MKAFIHHVGIESTDPATSLGAFATFLGAEIEHADGAQWLKGPNFLVRAAHGSGPGGEAPVHALGIAHVCLQMRDPAAARAALERAGVAYLADPVSLGTGFHYCYARDAEHRLLELETAPFMTEHPRGWFAHVAFVTDDLERIVRFYSAFLDLPVFPGGPFRNNPKLDAITGLAGVEVEAGWLRGANLTLEFWRYHAPGLADGSPRQTGYTHVAFEVEDVAAAVARAESLGATRDEDGDGLQVGIARALRDPDDNRIILLSPDAQHAHLSIAALSAPEVIGHVLPARDAWARGGVS